MPNGLLSYMPAQSAGQEDPYEFWRRTGSMPPPDMSRPAPNEVPGRGMNLGQSAGNFDGQVLPLMPTEQQMLRFPHMTGLAGALMQAKNRFMAEGDATERAQITARGLADRQRISDVAAMQRAMALAQMGQTAGERIRNRERADLAATDLSTPPIAVSDGVPRSGNLADIFFALQQAREADLNRVAQGLDPIKTDQERADELAQMLSRPESAEYVKQLKRPSLLAEDPSQKMAATSLARYLRQHTSIRERPSDKRKVPWGIMLLQDPAGTRLSTDPRALPSKEEQERAKKAFGPQRGGFMPLR